MKHGYRPSINQELSDDMLIRDCTTKKISEILRSRTRKMEHNDTTCCIDAWPSVALHLVRAK